MGVWEAQSKLKKETSYYTFRKLAKQIRVFTALNDVQSQPRHMAKSEGMMMEANLKMLLTLHQQTWFDRLMCKM
jgi:hypothetical protein